MAVSVINSQRPSIVRLPNRIEIQHKGDLPLRAAVRLIDVAGLGGARRVPGVVQFHFEQPPQQIAGELQPQIFEPVHQPPLPSPDPPPPPPPTTPPPTTPPPPP